MANLAATILQHYSNLTAPVIAKQITKEKYNE